MGNAAFKFSDTTLPPIQPRKLAPSKLDYQLLTYLPASFAILVGTLLLLFPSLKTLKCERLQSNQGSCQFTQAGLIGSNTREIQLVDFREAKVEAHQHHNPLARASTEYRVNLHTSTQTIPFTGNSVNRQAQESIATTINQFVENPEQRSLKVQEDERFRNIVPSLLLIGGGIIWLALLLSWAQLLNQPPSAMDDGT
jgi:hypothetical protein